ACNGPGDQRYKIKTALDNVATMVLFAVIIFLSLRLEGETQTGRDDARAIILRAKVFFVIAVMAVAGISPPSLAKTPGQPGFGIVTMQGQREDEIVRPRRNPG